jgi:hypothetical protein
MKAWLIALALCAAGVASADPLPAPFTLPGQQGSQELPAPLGIPGFAPASSDQPAMEPQARPEDAKHDTKNSTLVAIKLIAGLIVLMVLAYLGGHRKVVRFQERLGIGGIITAGFPFVALGALASHPDIAILNADVLSR